MAKISIDTAADHVSLDGFDGRYGPVEGYTVGFEHYAKDDDPTTPASARTGGWCWRARSSSATATAGKT